MKRIGRTGFTLIELSLSIAFIGILSIIVVVLINNSVTSYHRGIILNEINTVGMDLIEDMRLSVQNSEAKTLIGECDDMYAGNVDLIKACQTDGAETFASVVKYDQVSVGKKGQSSAPVYGAFCTGNYSYLWNSGYLFQTADESKIHGSGDKEGIRLKLVYRLNGENKNEESTNFRLLKVKDEGRWICKAGVTDSNAKKRYLNALSMQSLLNNRIDISNYPIEEDPRDILADESGLAVYDLTSTATAGESNQNMFYSVSFILGTVRGGINIKTAGDYCTPPGDMVNSEISSFDYCAINKFNFAAMATGG